ncbi:uncharacterized protein N0V89_006498 [Didymosphaeria variabile]|uniref:Uncharacterized protein n=1 Tax=Didymosphaeria variabile TaxID=1932322 RepID=A0A9W9C8K1_9PLEO|nr:uncharacterized protein N0V89_006498 [Didymosphaeria variabile]KAJ4351159.1 hypothetical protein N0V89_006498 [Didymosphaeria variabile]
MAFNLDEIDQHMANLRSTLRFFSEALERTDHNSPDWLATDLISLRNQTGRLQDGMQKFTDQLQAGGLAERKASNKRARLSLEGAERPTPSSTPLPSSPQVPNSASARPTQRQPQDQPTSPPQEEYEVQRIDVTEEVNRRLREARLRRLVDSPSTSQKRKFDAYDSMENWGETEGATDQEAEYMGRSPTKRIRASGTFEPIAGVMKRKEEGITMGFEDVGKEERGSAKKRRRQ